VVRLAEDGTLWVALVRLGRIRQWLIDLERTTTLAGPPEADPCHPTAEVDR
jgi:hypothetical protein